MSSKVAPKKPKLTMLSKLNPEQAQKFIEEVTGEKLTPAEVEELRKDLEQES